MTVYTSEQLQKWRDEKAERRRIYDRIFQEHCKYIREGKNQDESFDLLASRFDVYGKPLTRRIFNNILDNRSVYINPATASLSDALFIRTLSSLANDLNVMREHYHEQLDEIEMLQDSGAEWYETEEVESTGGKFGASVTTKKIRVSEAKAQVLEKIAKLPDWFYRRLTDLLPKSQVNVFTQSDSLSQRKLSDIEREIALLQSQRTGEAR